MLRNYLTVGLRALARSKGYAFINIFGLALGLAACLLILLYVRYEESYDGWLKGADRAFQLQTHYRPTERGGEEMNMQMSAIAAGRALKKDFPQVEEVVYVRSFAPVIIQNGQASQVPTLRMVDGNLFDIFQVPFLRSDPRTALGDTHSAVLSESEAKRRFPGIDPVGRTFTIVDNQGNVDYRVTGVFRDFPKNSSFSADIVARFDLEQQFSDRPGQLTRWSSQQGWNYVKLRPGADADEINRQIPAWERRNIPDETAEGGQRSNAADFQDYRLVNIGDVHLGKAQRVPVTPGNDRGSLAAFAAIALLVLGMACVNFTNLATARASQRAREVALRKVLGATRRQLVVQFVGESVLVTTLAMFVALAMVELLLPRFNDFLGADIRLDYFGSGGVLLPVVLLVLIVGIVGGLYPSLYLSRFEPARILKANRSAADSEGSGRLRNALVVAQFAVSITLIVCTSVIYAQTLYARTMDAGYRRDGLLQVDNFGFKGVTNDMARRIEEQVRRLPGVEAAALTQIAVAPGGNSMSSFYPAGTVRGVDLGQYGVDTGFFRAMGMTLLAGRDFSDANGRDDATTPFPMDPAAERAFAARGANIVVTREAARRLGFRSPQAAIGAQLKGELTQPQFGLVPVTIIGVVDDARFRTLREPLQPIVYTMQRNGFSQLAIRFRGVAPNEIRDRIEQVWHRMVPQVPFKADFADDLVRQQYRQDTARGQLFAAFTLLAIVIGCLGLFGLASFTAERRTKEIGIRKVLGARTRDIVRLLVWQFSRPVLIANLIAWPVAWWVMRGWLNGFDQRIPLGPTPFLAAAALALAIAVATVASHAIRVARSNPIHALRYE
ncbi:MAG TPA: ABC transporter permease [Allosphingosinicella sp.]|jgi:putative ABC transport system permease protein|nr:ABC transporter permease [Allosphingosinicella sp.]